jgi:hypothetical protein
MAALFERILNEARTTELDNGYVLKSVKSAEKGYWDLKVKSPDGEVTTIPEFFYYREGYDQGMGSSSQRQFYLQTKIGYNAGNGGGVSSRAEPFISHRLKQYIEEIIEEEGVEALNARPSY